MAVIAIVTPSIVGHHATYLRLYTGVLLDMGYTVAAYLPGNDWLSESIAISHPQAISRLSVEQMHYPPPLRIKGNIAIPLNKLRWIHLVSDYIRNSTVKPDMVFHTWLDNCLSPGITALMTDLLFPFRWTGLYLHPWYLRKDLSLALLRQGPLANHAALRSSRCPCIAVLDEGIVDKLYDHIKPKQVIAFPDIADDVAPDTTYPPVAEIRRRAAGRKVVGLMGVLTPRKGVMTLIAAAREIKECFFVLAGELPRDSFTPEDMRIIDDFIKSEPDNFLGHFQTIPQEPQFNAIVDACDIVYAVYRDFLSSSNLLTKAAIFNKPVVVSNSYCMGERVNRYNIGLTVGENSVAESIAAIMQLSRELDTPGTWNPDRFAAYRQQHSIDQLRLAMKKLFDLAEIKPE